MEIRSGGTSEYEGWPVILLKDYDSCCENGTLLYTVKNRELKAELSESYDIIDISSVELYRELLQAWYDRFFERNKSEIVFCNDLIVFKGVKILDPRIVDENEWGCFLQEAGDIILPELFEENSRIDEGAYRLNTVGVKSGDVVIDAGANLGVFSAIAAARNAAKCYAFEPMKKNYEYLVRQAEEYKDVIVPVNYALSMREEDAFISTNGSESSMYFELENNDKELIKCISLNLFVERNEIDKIDFIKADIEGAECDMLRGAKKVLRDFAPKLAICTYHRPTDKEELTEIITESNPNYKIEYKWKKLYAHVE